MKWKLMAVLATPALLLGCKKESDQSGDKVTLTVSTTDQNGHIAPPPPSSHLTGPAVPIVALGDSLFAGYGLQPGQSYPSALAAALQKTGVNAQIVNAGVSGDTTADGLARLDFVLDAQPQKPAAVLISLGGNDMLRSVPPEETAKNLDAILTKLDQRGIKAVLFGLLAAPNLGADYGAKFNAIYPELAKKHHAVLVPFFIQSLVADPGLVQADHIHPTWKGVGRMVDDTIGTVASALPKPGPRDLRPAPPPAR